MIDRISALSDELGGEGDKQPGVDVVSEITSILAAIPDRTAFLNALLRTSRRCFLSNHEAILSYHAPSRRWFVEASQDLKEDAIEEINGLSRTVIEKTRSATESILIPDTNTDELTKGSRSVRMFNIQSVLTAPINVESELWGLIYLANTCIPRAFDAESRKQLEQFAAFAGMAITLCEEVVRLGMPALKRREDDSALLEDVRSPAMMQVLSDLRLAAPTDASVLLVGETGTGKDILARWIHDHSKRKARPFVQINCAELDTDLIEVELFGVESGVATGVSFREGKVKVADGGTVFLNEIGELPLSVQAKLLRVIEERVVERVGGRNLLGVDVRFICATNRDLERGVELGHFRSDLFHRINVFGIRVPSLSQRREDIPQLTLQILKRICKRMNRPMLQVSDASLTELSQRDWNGNIRELANFIERTVLRSQGDELELDHSVKPGAKAASTSSKRTSKTASLKRAVEVFESAHIREALQRNGWIEVRAARQLGLPASTLRSKMKKLGIKPPKRIR